ncbi:MAG: cell division protein FtsZ [Candidatus ainarchaeum sp.]|nr:cell division protein FtsZ [Candidatus ainarchaeum sp.]
MKSIVENAVVKTSTSQSSDKLEEFGAPKIMVIGCGGAGCNTINRIAAMGVAGATLCAINTDKQHLAIVNDEVTKILIGKSVTRGLGAGGYPEIGAKAAEVSRNALEEILQGVDMLFISAGMGGGTGTGSAPVVASIAREQGAIVISMVTYPFALEKARLIKAEEGIENLRKVSDTVVVIDNNRLVELVPNLPLQDAFKVADEVVARTVRGITETITQPSLMNLDYADVRSTMSNQGLSVIAVGESKSVDKVNEVVEDTLKNSLLDIDIAGASGCLIHITGGADLTLGEASAIGEMLTERVDPKANVIWGARVDPTFENKIEVICIFTGVHSPFIRSDAVKNMGKGQETSRKPRDLDLEFIN